MKHSWSHLSESKQGSYKFKLLSHKMKTTQQKWTRARFNVPPNTL